MALVEDKENVAPLFTSNPDMNGSSPAKKASKKGRSKSIGPGGLEESNENTKNDAKNRRKSAFVPAVKGILPSNEDAERKAARRKSMANRRVSFAPEATLHTWDVIEYMRDHTTSTESSESTRRASTMSNGDSSPHTGPSPSSPSAPSDSDEASSPLPEADQEHMERRRGSGVPPVNFNNPDDILSSSGISGSSDASGSEDEEDMEMEMEDETDTAMSLDMDDETMKSTAQSEASSTSSSAQLERNLNMAAHTAGTRGIEFDEYGEMSMELAGDEITNAFKPWVERAANDLNGSAALDQENVNPFSPAFQAAVVSKFVAREATIEEEEEGGEDEDMSMDVTKAVGGILRPQAREPASSPFADATMEFTQAVGRIHNNPAPESDDTRTGQKRRRSTTEAGSPGVALPAAQNKRRRSSVARFSMSNDSDSMDLTMAVGGIKNSSSSPLKIVRRRSVATRRTSTAVSEQGEVTMDFTRPVGGIQRAEQENKRQSIDSIEENEELTMEMTTVFGGVKPAIQSAVERPATPQDPRSPQTKAPNSTPKDQERFKNTPEEGPRKLLTPILKRSAETISSPSRRQSSPAKISANVEEDDDADIENRNPVSSPNRPHTAGTPRSSLLKAEVAYPELPPLDLSRFLPKATSQKSNAAKISFKQTPQSEPKERLGLQVEAGELSPTEEKQLRSTPVKASSTPQTQSTPQKQVSDQELSSPMKQETPQRQLSVKKTAVPQQQTFPRKSITPQRASSPPKKSYVPKHSSPLKLATPLKYSDSPEIAALETPRIQQTPEHLEAVQIGRPQDVQTLTNSIKFMSTPRKESLKAITPKKQASPTKKTPRARPTPRMKTASNGSPGRQLSSELLKVSSDAQPQAKIRLQQFLDEAGIRFMDLTTTKRRLTVAPTPSKLRKARAEENEAGEAEPAITLETAVVAASCTEPELEMFRHACHELKRYIQEGKSDIKELEAQTYQETPPLIQAYMVASPDQKAAIDAQLLAIKTHARLSSKELWYSWRSQLLGELMMQLQGIGEGLLKDDEALQAKEEILARVLPDLVEQQAELQQEAERLEEAALAVPEEEKAELDAARERMVEVDAELVEKRRVLEALQREAQKQEALEEHLVDSKEEAIAAIAEADRVREACRSISLDELNALKESVRDLEETYNWTIASASFKPATTVTMTYKSQLQLFFHPHAFLSGNNTASSSNANAPISLTYIGSQNPLPTTLRFFLQLLRATLHGLPQNRTKASELLSLVSSGWDAACTLAETARRLAIEGPTDVKILSDEKLSLASSVLLPGVKTKVRVEFVVLAGVLEESLQVEWKVEVGIRVVYGEVYNEEKMCEFVKGRVGEDLDGWEGVVRELRQKLVARGAKGERK